MVRAEHKFRSMRNCENLVRIVRRLIIGTSGSTNANCITRKRLSYL